MSKKGMGRTLVLHSLIMLFKYSIVTFLPITLVLLSCSEPRPVRHDAPDVVVADTSDKEMSAAIRTARSNVEEFIKTLSSPAVNQRGFAVKKAFRTDNGTVDQIWVANVRYDRDRFVGTIDESPMNISGVRHGDTVSVAKSYITDWIFQENGQIVGGYTVRVQRKRMSERDAREFDKEGRFRK